MTDYYWIAATSQGVLLVVPLRMDGVGTINGFEINGLTVNAYTLLVKSGQVSTLFKYRSKARNPWLG